MSRLPCQVTLKAMMEILRHGQAHTQRELVDALKTRGLSVSQPMVSRYLRHLNAIKVKKQGEILYQLPGEAAPPNVEANVLQLVRGMDHNNHMIVVHTAPAAAGLLARLIKHHLTDIQALGVIAGHDTIFVALSSGCQIDQAMAQLNSLLQGE